MSARSSDDDLLQPGWRSSRRKVGAVTLHVVEAGKAGAPLVILLHGFPEFWWAWRHQIGPLAAAGFHVVVPDLRGYNLSDVPDGIDDYRLDTLAADVVALADTFGAERFHLVGHDWGAVIGWWVAALHATRLDQVVLMDGPHPDVWGAQMLKHPSQALRSTYAAFFQLPWLPEATLGSFDHAGLRTMLQGSGKADTFEPGALNRYVAAWRNAGSLTGMLNYYRALRRRERPAAPARITPPTLILWAEEDRFLERHIAEASLAQCDDARLEMIADATHWLHLEQPARINARIIAWLSEAPAQKR
ncbi:alpha/beta fold hydrolase [Sphingomonas jatrophae]|uniref:Pimeloyl-ACP methyl ester carboxylesterase n=1 Tax=Sphingomonas jatrophae TaxID=1166337 RepID=A0A1I6K256_9SPHN|nr:alpha/beta hydrolase [Sphingomonas jatrophae]SFR85335.1 Pimeloyl-ACP methyl ester carboxylesterase [Sphingomonas jatrophae]